MIDPSVGYFRLDLAAFFFAFINIERSFVVRKKSFVLFILLLGFWLVISGTTDVEHIIIGIILSLLTTWFWGGYNPKLPSILSLLELLLFGRCIVMMIWYVIKANIDVAKILLFSSKSISPTFIEIDFGIKSDWGRVFLANCITITPGTITVDIDPETNIFTVHALTEESGLSLKTWRMVNEIKNLEKLVQRRESHAVDNGRINDSNSISSN